MDLLHLCVTPTYFQYKHYKQLHGRAMGSPISIAVAEIVMQNIEEQALATYSETLPLCGYVRECVQISVGDPIIGIGPDLFLMVRNWY